MEQSQHSWPAGRRHFAAYLSTRLGNADCALGVTVWPEAGHLPGLALASLAYLPLVLTLLVADKRP